MSSSPYSRFLILPLFLTFMSGCVAASSSSSPQSALERVNPNVISVEEIRTAGASNAFDLVQGLRPRWLFKRGPQSLAQESDIIIYLGTAKMGGIQSLRDIPALTLESVEFFDAVRANYKFGRGHPYGAIVVNVTGGRSK